MISGGAGGPDPAPSAPVAGADPTPDGPLVDPASAALVVAVVAAVVHVGALANGFAYDDAVLILGDPGIQQLSGLWERLGRPSWPGAFGDIVGGWRPVTTASWAFVWAIGAGSAVAFHAFGIAVHALVSGVVVLFLGRLMPALAAFAGGLLFAVHPVHVEAVVNVAGTAEPLAALFAVTAAWLHLGADRQRYGPGRGAAVVSLFALAVLSKEGAAVLPALLLLLDAARHDPSLRRFPAWIRARLPLYLALGLVLALLLVARVAVVGGVTTASHPPGASILQEMPRHWTVLGAWPHYTRLLLMPIELSADYGPELVPIAFGWTASAVLGLVLALFWLAVAVGLWRAGGDLDPQRPSSRLIALGVLWVAAALLPVANLLYLGPVLVAERTLYLPSVGVAIAAGYALHAALGRYGRPALLVGGVIVLAGAARSAARVPAWASSESIMTALIEEHPESGRGWLALGQRLMAQERYPEARRAFSYAIGMLNSEYKESTEIASHLMTMGRPGQARLLLERAWREQPEWPTAPGLLAAAELALDRPVQAESAARAAAILQPDNPSMHHLLAGSLSRQGEHREAVDARLRAIDTGFRDRAFAWLLLVGEYMNLGDTLGASAALDSAQARARTPQDQEAVREARLRLQEPGND